MPNLPNVLKLVWCIHVLTQLIFGTPIMGRNFRRIGLEDNPTASSEGGYYPGDAKKEGGLRCSG
jgi:hypothetical protein